MTSRPYGILMTAVIMVFVIQNPLHAAPVTRIDGITTFGFSVDSPNVLDPLFDRISLGPIFGIANKFDNARVGPFATTFSDFNLSRTGKTVTSTSGMTFTEFAVSQATPENRGTREQMFNLPLATPPFDASATANFELSMINAFVPAAAGLTNTLIIQGREMLVANTSTFGLDMQFFSITLVAPAGTDFANIIETRGRVAVSGLSAGSFFQSVSDTDLIKLSEVPEPNALSLTLIGLAGLWFVRRIRVADRPRLNP